VRSYGQYCPIARASELLAERWSIIILRNVVILGCRTFNEIADCAPGLSRGLLSKRLRDLERAGVLDIRPKPDGPGSIYEPTAAGRELSEVMVALQHWGSKWADLTPEQAHPGVVLWMWATFSLDRARLPQRRKLVRFDYPTSNGATPRSARPTPAARKISSSSSTIRWRSPAGTWARSSGATPCVPERSRCAALGPSREAFPPGTGTPNTAPSRSTPQRLPEHAPPELPLARGREVHTVHFSSRRTCTTIAGC
jgi:DNA-binding HxlR family transcriptional regulator